MTDRQIFINAPVGATPEVLGAYLDRMCGEDEALRARVEALIAADAAAGEDFLEGGIPPEAEPTVDHRVAPVLEKNGDVIGNYKLLQVIGEGGFGVVYMAEQLRPVRRRVAFKVIKLGMDTRQVVARFEAERQALALMEHPNIAKVLDAGSTDTGRPFFVMELVRGVPITEFCDERSLSTEERLALFTDVCRAVQHAHQKGIIHRDLKPSNVMVTLHDDTPVVKVIDFGVAKATQGELTEKTLFTRFEQFLGTPAYMSPEQAQLSGLDLDTRSDIYALGVLLYELLTGRTPFDSKKLASAGYEEMRRVIREDEPSKPSTRLGTLAEAELTTLAKRRRSDPGKLRSRLRGDLDWIVMKALEKDRTRRYETANALAMDVQRHLADEPVVAGPPGASYRLRKLARRNKGVVAGMVAIFTALSLGVLGLAFFNRELDEKEKSTRLNLYAADMSAVSQALEQDNLGLARRLLERHIPAAGDEDLRGFEWRHFHAVARGDHRQTLSGHRSMVCDLAFSGDGRWMASADVTGLVTLWETSSSISPVARIEVDDLRIDFQACFFSELALAPDGRFLVLLVDGGRLAFYDLTDRERPQRREVFEGVSWFALAPAGPEVLLAIPRGIALANHETGEILREYESSSSGNLCFLGRDGRRATFLSAEADALCVLDLDTAAERRIPLTIDHAERIAVDGDGTRVAVCHYWTRAVEVIDLESGRQLVGPGLAEYTPYGGWVWDAAFSPDGRWLAACSSDQTVRLYEVDTGRQVTRFRGHGAEVWRVAYSPDGASLVSGGQDDALLVWDPGQRDADAAVTGITVRFHPSEDLCLVVGPGGRGDSLRDLRTGRDLWSTGKGERALGFSPGGGRVVCLRRGSPIEFPSPPPPDLDVGAHGVEVQRLQTLLNAQLGSDLAVDGDFGSVTTGIVRQFQEQRGLPSTGMVDAVTWKALHEGNAAAFFDTLVFRDLGGRQTGTPVRLDACPSAGRDLDLTPDGRRVVGGFLGGIIGIWDAETGEREHWIQVPGLRIAPAHARISADSRYLTTCDIGSSHRGRVWDLSTGSEVLSIRSRREGNPEGHKNAVSNVAVSPDGKVVATASWDGTIGLWGFPSGDRLATFTGHKAGVYQVVFSPDGRTLASGGEDGALKLWNVATRRPMGTLEPGFGQVFFLEFSPDGEFLAAGSRSGQRVVRFFHAAPIGGIEGLGIEAP